MLTYQNLVTPQFIAQELLNTQYDEQNGWQQFKEQMKKLKQQFASVTLNIITQLILVKNELSKTTATQNQNLPKTEPVPYLYQENVQKDPFTSIHFERINKFSPQNQQMQLQTGFPNAAINPQDNLFKNQKIGEINPQDGKLNQLIWNQNYNANFNDLHANKQYYYNNEMEKLTPEQKLQIDNSIRDVSNYQAQNQNFQKPSSNLYQNQYQQFSNMMPSRPLYEDQYSKMVELQAQQYNNSAMKGYLGPTAMQEAVGGNQNQMMFGQISKQVKTLGGIEDTVSKMEQSLRENEMKFIQSANKEQYQGIPPQPSFGIPVNQFQQQLPVNQFQQQQQPQFKQQLPSSYYNTGASALNAFYQPGKGSVDKNRSLSIEKSRKEREKNELFLKNLKQLDATMKQ